jgi:hypothetical protein
MFMEKAEHLHQLLKKNGGGSNFLTAKAGVEMDKLILDEFICGMDAACKKWRELPEYGAKVYSIMEATFIYILAINHHS